MAGGFLASVVKFIHIVLCNMVKVEREHRRQGRFFTPQVWVEQAHLSLNKHLGGTWQDDFVIWDPAWGTGNLTKDIRPKHLFCSTLFQSEIDEAVSQRVNEGSEKFQFDFLNHDDEELERRCPALMKHIKSRDPILFFLNPPYAKSGNIESNDGLPMKGVGKTWINTLMLREGYGKSSSNLYAQFLYRILRFKLLYGANIRIALFSPTLFMSGKGFKEFRERFFSHFGVHDGFLFKASEFENVKDDWAISFLHMSEGGKKNQFDLAVKENRDGVIEEAGVKRIYNTDDMVSASEWLKIGEVKDGVESIKLSSALNVADRGEPRKLTRDAIGWMTSKPNSVYYNDRSVNIMSVPYSDYRTAGFSITPDNLFQAVAFFAARRCITGRHMNWLNQKDEYLMPNTGCTAWVQFTHDSLVYALFNQASHQSSMRMVQYANRTWDIRNQFFWISRNRMIDMAGKVGFDELIDDAETDSERHVYSIMDRIAPSDEAQIVLELVDQMVEDTMKVRKEIQASKKELYLSTWDAGFAQIKHVLSKDMKNEFAIAYGKLEDSLRERIGDVGFF